MFKQLSNYEGDSIVLCCLEMVVLLSSGKFEVIGYSKKYPDVRFDGHIAIRYCPCCGKSLELEET